MNTNLVEYYVSLGLKRVEETHMMNTHRMRYTVENTNRKNNLEVVMVVET